MNSASLSFWVGSHKREAQLGSARDNARPWALYRGGSRSLLLAIFLAPPASVLVNAPPASRLHSPFRKGRDTMVATTACDRKKRISFFFSGGRKNAARF